VLFLTQVFVYPAIDGTARLLGLAYVDEIMVSNCVSKIICQIAVLLDWWKYVQVWQQT
jgi:hypothetical protein